MTQTDARPGASAIEDVLALSPLQQGLFSMATLTEGGAARTAVGDPSAGKGGGAGAPGPRETWRHFWAFVSGRRCFVWVV